VPAVRRAQSTAVGVLSGQLKPNLGQLGDPPDWREIVTYYRGSELQTLLLAVSESRLTSAVKPQMTNRFARDLGDKTVAEALAEADERGVATKLIEQLELGASTPTPCACVGTSAAAWRRPC
jgi:ATP-binding cassette, sub-family E, member 1